MNTIRQIIIFSAVLLLVMGISPLVSAQEFPGAKVLDSGTDPVGLGKDTTTEYSYTINLDVNFDNTADVEDVVPAEFDMIDMSASCGAAIANTPGKSNGKGNPFKLDPHIITWDLDACDTATSQSLTVTITTDNNPGHARKDIEFYEPTECGPLYINDGAVFIDPVTGEPLTEISNSLSVATCLDESDIAECVDDDGDGWSISCGDCNDEDSDINPGAQEICDDDVDNDCDGLVDLEDEDCL